MTAGGEEAVRKRSEWETFGGAADYEERIGRRAHEVDREAVLALWHTPPGAWVLDLPSGAGRMSALLAAERGTVPLAADVNLGMLRAARAATVAPAVCCDAFQLPFRDASFAGVITLRLAFHYRDLAGLGREIRRVLAPGGCWVLDTLNRGSLRHLFEPLRSITRPGGRRSGLHFRTRRSAATDLERSGLRIEATRERYLLPTRTYRILPGPVGGFLLRLERFTPRSVRVLTFWRVRRPG